MPWKFGPWPMPGNRHSEPRSHGKLEPPHINNAHRERPQLRDAAPPHHFHNFEIATINLRGTQHLFLGFDLPSFSRRLLSSCLGSHFHYFYARNILFIPSKRLYSSSSSEQSADSRRTPSSYLPPPYHQQSKWAKNPSPPPTSSA